jgi:hypothetical protein
MVCEAFAKVRKLGFNNGLNIKNKENIFEETGADHFGAEASATEA